MADAPRIYNLPVVPETAFNTLSATLLGEKGALVWTDHNKDGAMTPGEFSGDDVTAYVSAGDINSIFTPKFETHYRRLAEQLRQDSVAKELSLTFRKTLTTDLDAAFKALPASLHLTPAEEALYKRAIAKLLEVAPIMQQLFEHQAGYAPDLKTTTGLTANDTELIARYKTPWCLGDTSETCTALPNFAARQSAVMASGIQGDLCKTESSSPFSVVVKEDGRVKAIPYATAYADQLQPVATLLKEAAEILQQIPREKAQAAYLSQLATDFAKTDAFPFVASNALWIDHQKSDSILFTRIGPDEDSGVAGGDPCHKKAGFHFSIGLKNLAVATFGAQYQPLLQQWEDRYAILVGDPKLYTAQKVVVLPPDIIDIVYQNGDDNGGPNGTTIGQTLPNWCGADGKQDPCTRRTMIYANKAAQAYGPEVLDKYIKPLFHPDQRRYLRQGSDNFSAIVLHELAHNLGPQPGKPKPGTKDTYQAPLKEWGGMIEEFKAQMGALYFPTLDLEEKRLAAKAGKVSARGLAKVEEAYKYDMVNTVSWSLNHLLRATRTGAFKSRSNYSQLSAATLGYFAERGALEFDAPSKTWKLNFEKFPEATTALTQKVVGMYARANFKEVDDFMTHYLSGPGFALLHTDRLQEVAGKKPSVIFNYEIRGIPVPSQNATTPRFPTPPEQVGCQ